MKSLIIVRHGKSDWTHEGLSDIDRPLKERGVNDAYKMAKRIKKKKIIPELIVSSPANRALHTATIFAREIEILLKNIEINEMLYFYYENEVLEVVKNTSEKVSTLMIFGHNPTFTNFANYFLKNNIDNIPTSGIVILNFDTESWKSISIENLTSEYIDYPKKEVEQNI